MLHQHKADKQLVLRKLMNINNLSNGLCFCSALFPASLKHLHVPLCKGYFLCSPPLLPCFSRNSARTVTATWKDWNSQPCLVDKRRLNPAQPPSAWLSEGKQPARARQLVCQARARIVMTAASQQRSMQQCRWCTELWRWLRRIKWN